jgi:hypothetical protein
MDIADYLEQKPCQEIAIAGLIVGTRTVSRAGPRQTPVARGIVGIKKWDRMKRHPLSRIKRSTKVGTPGYQMHGVTVNKGLSVGLFDNCE